MPMKPHKGESQSDFMSRCVPEMMGDGKRDNDQAVAACLSIWREHEKSAPKEYADPGYRADAKKRYPIDTVAMVRQSWYSACSNKKDYTDGQLSRIKIRITNAWKTLIDKAGPPVDDVGLKALRSSLVTKRLTKEDDEGDYDVPDPEEDEKYDDFLERCVEELVDNQDADEGAAEVMCDSKWEEESRSALSQPVMHKTKSTEGSGMEFILSDATPDRFGDIVEPSGWVVDHFKNNPIALFNHNSGFPIGKWKNIRITDKDLRADLDLAPRGTSERIDEIRNLIDADILRATSVGFRPLEHAPVNPKDPWGGTKYTKHELVECSVVAVPANPNALAVAKSLGVSKATIRMVFGEDAGTDTTQRRSFSSARGKHADTTGGGGSKTSPASMPQPSERERGRPMLLSQRIQEAEKRHLALQDQLDKHLEGIDDENPTEEQMVVTEDLTAKIETAVRHLNSLKAIEKRNGAGASDAGSETHRRRANGSMPAPAILKLREKTQDPIDYMFRAALVRCKAKADNADIDVIRHKVYGDDEVTRVACDMMLKAATAPAETTVPGWAQELVRTIWAQFMEVLLPMSVFPKLSAAGLALTFGANGRIVIPTRNLTPSISGSFVGEGQPIPVRQGAFASQTLTPKKMAVITTWTREMDEYSIPAIEGLLRQAIMEDTAIALDTVLLDNNPATAIRPPGLRNYQAGIAAATGANGFTNFTADYAALMGSLITLTNGNVRSPVMILNPQQTLALSLQQPPNAAAPLFPFIAMLDAGRLLRAALIESTTVTPGMAVLVDAADFTTAGVEGPRMEISDQATLHMEDTTPLDITSGASPVVTASPVKSMWQTDSLALRLVMRMNWILRRPVVAWMTGVTWHS